jgi:hypothetical protein
MGDQVTLGKAKQLGLSHPTFDMVPNQKGNCVVSGLTPLINGGEKLG